MALSERARDWIVTTVFLGVIGGLVLIGWMNREAPSPLIRSGPAPPIALDRLEGGLATLEDYRGRVVMVNVWATWCAPCQREMPSMQRAYEQYRDQGFEILAVTVDREPGTLQPDGRTAGLVSEFVQRYGLTFPILLDPTGETERLYGVTALPTTFLIDREGQIRVREVGGRYWDQEPYVAMIRELLEE